MLVIASEEVPTGKGTMRALGNGSDSIAWAAAGVLRLGAGDVSAARAAGGAAGGCTGVATDAVVPAPAAGAAGFDRRGLSHVVQRIPPDAIDAPHMKHFAKVGPPGGIDVTRLRGVPQGDNVHRQRERVTGSVQAVLRAIRYPQSRLRRD